MNVQNMLLFFLLAALQVADGFLTWRVLASGGRELNPLVRVLIDRVGAVFGLVVAKAGLVIVAGRFIVDQPLTLLLIDIFYAGVVVHNWRQLKIKRGGV